MTKPEIVASIAEKAGVTKKVASATLEAFVETVMDSLKKGKRLLLWALEHLKLEKESQEKVLILRQENQFIYQQRKFQLSVQEKN